MRAWRRTEPRTARPFFAVSKIGSALDHAVILIGDRETEKEEDVVHLDPADFDDLHVAILPNLDLPVVREVLEEKVDKYSLLLTIRDPVFKRRVVHKDIPLLGDLPERLPLTKDIIQAYGHKRELHVTIALALIEDMPIPVEPGWPQHRGSWIAKRTFKIKLRSIRSTFDLRAMTPQEAKHLTGWPGALLYAEVNGELLSEELDEDQSLAIVYIAQEIYEAMQRTKDGPLLQNLVMAEVVASVLADAASDIQEIESAPKGTPIATILEQLGEDAPMSLNDLKNVVNNPIKLRALVHDRTDFVKCLRSV